MGREGMYGVVGDGRVDGAIGRDGRLVGMRGKRKKMGKEGKEKKVRFVFCRLDSREGETGWIGSDWW